MSKIKIIGISGSARRDSLNKKLVQVALKGAGEAGAEAIFIDLKDFPLPIYDQDLEDAEGLPENARKLKKIFCESQGIIISNPEYNSSLSALLKNTIDWVSRKEEGERPLQAFDGKVAALLSASPGALGGLRGLVHLRSILGNIKVIVLPDQIAIGQAHQAFDGEGNLADSTKQKSVKELGMRLVDVANRLNT